MKNRLPFMLMLLVPISLAAQPGVYTLPLGTLDTVRIASYNLLDYPGSDFSTRDPYFRRVIHSMKPDVLVVQEMTSQTGVNTFLSDVLNTYQAGLYSTIAFHDGPDTDNHIFFKSSKVSFVSASYIPTALRDIAEYVLQVTSSGEQIRLYSVHLKASQGYESDRLAEATILRNQIGRAHV
jgi:endonuclease/exonuclease/phosphatase family metal-dependent hydrolase